MAIPPSPARWARMTEKQRESALFWSGIHMIAVPSVVLVGLIALIVMLLAGCSSSPPIVSADTSCERFRHISATDAQIKVFADNWEVMESYADQAVAHNLAYDAHCLRGGE